VIEYTIGYIGVEGQVEADFDRARRRAIVGWVSNRLRVNCGRLSAFDEVRKALRAEARLCLGIRIVEVAKIVESVGRWRQFDRWFMPAEASVGARWKRVDLAFRCGEELPPVSLYKIGGYFVLDGNHRVSVARYHGVEMIDAEVTEFCPRSLVGSPVSGTWQDLQGSVPLSR
jgi:hypothetical protein